MMRILLTFATIAITWSMTSPVDAGWPSWKLRKSNPTGCVDTGCAEQCVLPPVCHDDQACLPGCAPEVCLEPGCVEDICVDQGGCCEAAPRRRLVSGKWLRKSRHWLRKVCIDDGCIEDGCVDGCVDGCLDPGCLTSGDEPAWFVEPSPRTTHVLPEWHNTVPQQAVPGTGSVDSGLAASKPATPRSLFLEDAPAPALPAPKPLESSRAGQIPALPRIKAPGYVPEEL